MRTHLRLHVTYVHHPDYGDGSRERNVVAGDVAVAQLAKEGDGRPLRESVHLVEEHNERLARLLRKQGQEKLDPKIWRLWKELRDGG